MALKYTLNVSSQKKQDWVVEIDVPSYVGEPIELIGDRNPILIEYKGASNDNPFDNHIMPQSATFRVYDDNLDVTELQLIDDASVKCRVYLNGLLKHQGFIVSDGIMQPDSGVSSIITIKSIDGLELLDAIPYSLDTNYSPITVDGKVSSARCPMNIIRLVLYREANLDNILPIRWATSLKSEQYPEDDMLAGRNAIVSQGKLLQYSKYSGYWFLNEIMKTAQCWLYQRDGYWYIENRGDTIRNNGFMVGYEITTDTTAQTATPINIDLNTGELSNLFINQDAYWMMKKPLGGSNVVYNDTTNDNNVVPNGGFDLTSLGAIIDWYAVNNNIFISTGTPINGENTGNSALIIPSFSGGESAITFGDIPLDTQVLFKNALLGFKWMPISGYQLREGGYIDFSKFPMWISLKYNVGGQDLYLNEFGYWSNKNIDANAQVDSILWSNIQGGRLNINFNPNLNFFPGDEVVIGFLRNGSYEFYRIPFTTTMDVDAGLDYIVSMIPNSANPVSPPGQMYILQVSDYELNSAYTEKTNNYYQKIQIDGGEQMKPNDILDIQFQSKGLSNNIKLPSGLGKLSMQIYAKGGASLQLDDVYFRVNENHDEYQVRVSGSKSPIEDYEVGISSSFSGHMWSNYMDSYKTSDLSLNWVSNGVTASLTELYGRFILDWRRIPRRIFDGSIDDIVQCGDFLTIKGVKYVVMNASIQGDGITRVLAFEAALDSGSYSVTHIGTNDDNR